MSGDIKPISGRLGAALSPEQAAAGPIQAGPSTTAQVTAAEPAAASAQASAAAPLGGPTAAQAVHGAQASAGPTAAQRLFAQIAQAPHLSAASTAERVQAAILAVVEQSMPQLSAAQRAQLSERLMHNLDALPDLQLRLRRLLSAPA